MSADRSLRWSKNVLSADDLRTVNGHRELIVGAKTIVTPLATEQLRASGIQLVREYEPAQAATSANGVWGYAQEYPQAVVVQTVKALERDGIRFIALSSGDGQQLCTLARAVAECVSRGECRGGIVFCSDAALVCCVANKVRGIRAAPACNAQQAARALTNIGVNLLAVEMPGRTFFEIRQILRCLGKPSVCPSGVSGILQELEGHAHR